MEWQPIETAPEWQRVLVWQREEPKTKSCKTGVFTATLVNGEWTLTDKGKRGYGTPCLAPPPTHWMPLPEPPPSAQTHRR